MTKRREMTDERKNGRPTAAGTGQATKKLPPAALRALAEADARRKEYLAKEAENPVERGGRGGKDPARYGDWEVKGRAIDF
jgi:hypothetical protein